MRRYGRKHSRVSAAGMAVARRSVVRRMAVFVLVLFAVPAVLTYLAFERSIKNVAEIERHTSHNADTVRNSLQTAYGALHGLGLTDAKRQLSGVARSLEYAMRVHPEVLEKPEEMAFDVDLYTIVRNELLGKSGFILVVDPARGKVLLDRETGGAIAERHPGLHRALQETKYVETLRAERIAPIAATGLAGWRRIFTSEQPPTGSLPQGSWLITPLRASNSIAIAGFMPHDGLFEQVEAEVKTATTGIDHNLSEVQTGLARLRSTMRVTLAVIAAVAVVAFFLVAIYARRRLVQPVQKLTSLAFAVQKGDLAIRATPEGEDEIAILGRAFNVMLERVNRHIEELRAAQQQLVVAGKMVAVGTLAAGVSHEINNAVAFVHGHVPILRDMVSTYQSLIAELAELCDHNGFAEQAAAVRAAHDLDQIDADLPGVLDAIEEGSRRAKAIVRDLKTFSQSDDVERRRADIRECLESTVRLVEGTVKQRVTFVRQYEEGVPAIECYPRLLNQVFLNIIKNSTEVLTGRGHIWVALRAMPGGVEVRLRDDGPGMPADVRERIFEPFFTTKPVGQGTGLGLAVSHGIIARHGGRLECVPPESGGTEFVIFLPETPPPAADGAAGSRESGQTPSVAA